MLHPADTPVQFTRFLDERGLAVLDVVGGAARNGRRLLLGRPGTSSVTHVVATSLAARGATDRNDPVAAEQSVLSHASRVLRPGLQQSLPRVLERVEVHGLASALALTAVPHLGISQRLSKAVARDLVDAMPAWFAAVWTDSAEGTAPTSLGADAMRLVPSRTNPPGTPDAALNVLRRAHERIADLEVPLTLTHGCLCARHVVASEGSVAGVDDWGLGEPAGDPLRDLGRFVAHVSGDRLAEVLGGRTTFASSVRQLMGEAMSLAAVPARLWREVLALSQLELAVEARLRGDPYGMVRLGRAVRALQGHERTR